LQYFSNFLDLPHSLFGGKYLSLWKMHLVELQKTSPGKKNLILAFDMMIYVSCNVY